MKKSAERKIDWSLLYGDDARKFKARFFARKAASGGDAAYFALALGKKPRRTAPIPRFESAEKSQRVVVKARFGKSLKGHRKFLEVYMVQADKGEVAEKPVLFGTPLAEYRARMSENCLKFVISPENQRVPLEVLVSRLVRRCEIETGFRLCWEAAIHRNTGQIHAHLLVNGRDMDGRAVRFPPDLIKRKMREMAGEIATSLVGERSREEIDAAASRSLESLRWTQLDAEILTLAGISGGSVSPAGAAMQRRLQVLSKSGLAEWDCGSKRYALAGDFAESLRAQGRFNTFLAERKAAKMRGFELRLYGKGSPALSGTVEKVIKMDDEGVWNNALIVRAGKILWYAPIYSKLAGAKAGSAVSLSQDGGRVEAKVESPQSGREKKGMRGFLQRN